jgi:D-aspartate ligase
MMSINNEIPIVVCGDMNLLRCFAGLDAPTEVVAWQPHEVTLSSRFARKQHLIAPPTDAQRSLEDLERIGAAHSERPVLFYGTDDMLLLISRHRERLSRYFWFRMPDADLIEAVVDKNRFQQLCEARDLPVPPALACDASTPVERVLEKVGLPCAFKPSSHIGWLRSRASADKKPRKALVARTRGELLELHQEIKRHTDAFVAQRYVAGGEDRIYSYHAYLDQGSEPLGEFAGKKIRTYPMEAGVSTYLELVKDPEVIRLGREASLALGLVGPVKFDFKRDASDGRLYLFEVNARFTLWCYLGAKCGVNLPRIAYADLVGQDLSLPSDYATGVRWLSFGNDLRAFVRDYGPHGMSVGEWLRSYRGQKVYDVFSWNDPMPFGMSMLNYSRAVLGKLAPSRHQS